MCTSVRIFIYCQVIIVRFALYQLKYIRVPNHKVGPGVLLELQLMSKLQRSVHLQEKAASEYGVHHIPIEPKFIPLLKHYPSLAPSPNFWKFPKRWQLLNAINMMIYVDSKRPSEPYMHLPKFSNRPFHQ